MKFADAHYSGFASEMFRNDYSAVPQNCVNELKEYFNIGGRVIGVVFTIPDYFDLQTIINPDSAVIAMHRVYEKIIRSNSDYFKKYSPNDLDTTKLNLFISLEGLPESAIRNLLSVDTSHSVMVVGVLHNNNNEFGTSCSDNLQSKDMGLTEKGKTFIEELIRKKIIIDIAHCSKKTFFDIIKICSEKNGIVISSHSGLYDFNENSRNLKNEQIEAINDLAGGIGLIIHEPFIKSKYTPRTTFESYLKLFVYLKNVKGMNNVFIGSDFCPDIKPINGIRKLVDIPRAIIKFRNHSACNIPDLQDFAFNNLIKIFNKLN